MSEHQRSTEEQRTTSFGLWRYAFEYLKAARTLDDVDSNPWVASSVTYQCACQGLELAFKAFLRAKGFAPDDLRKMGHPLTRGMRAASANGLTSLSHEHVVAIEMIDPYYAEHEFRYIRTGVKEYPSLGVLLAAGATVLDAAAGAVAGDMGDEKLVHRMRMDTSATFGATPPPARR